LREVIDEPGLIFLFKIRSRLRDLEWVSLCPMSGWVLALSFAGLQVAAAYLLPQKELLPRFADIPSSPRNLLT